MKKTRMRLWSLLLTVAMVLTLLPATALAEGEGDPSTGQEETDGTEVPQTEGESKSEPVPLIDEGDVAAIGEQGYDTLGAAMQAVETGQTITIISDFSTEERIDIYRDGSFTLDLNGNTITSTIANQFINLNSAGAELTITDTSDSASGRIILTRAGVGFCIFRGTLNILGGTIESQGHWNSNGSEFGQQIVYLFGGNDPSDTDYTNFTLGEDATIASIENDDGAPVGAGYAVTVIHRSSAFSGAGDVAYGVNVDIYGETENAILYVNGTIKATEGNVPQLTLHDGAVIDGGIYAAGYADWVIEDAVVTGGTGMEIRAGTLVVNDGEINGTSTPTSVLPNGNGSTTDGAGIAVAQHTTELPIDVTINGGTITGFSAVYQSNPQGNEEAAIKKVTLSITGGTFATSNGGENAVYSENCTGFITGGTFSSNPEEYVPTGYECNPNDGGTYTVTAKSGMEASATPDEDNGTSSAEVGGKFDGNEGSEADNNVGVTGGTVQIDVTTGAKDSGSTTPVPNEGVTSTEVTISPEALTSVNENEDVTSVDLVTDVATVTVDEAAWNTLTSNAKGKAVTLSIEEKKDGTAEKATQWEVTAKAGSRDVFSEENSGNSTIKITVAYELQEGFSVEVYCLDNGQKVDSKYDPISKTLTWWAPHFSSYGTAEWSESSVAKVTIDGQTTYYDTLANAVAAVVASTDKTGTVTLLKDCSGNGVKVSSDSDIVIDFAGYTYDIDGETVGSTGTETNGFQLLRDSTIEFRNGTLTSSKAKILIQNYSNLTLKDMTLDGTELLGANPYVVSNNFGKVMITGDTSITAAPDGFAFDVYYWPGGGYGEGVSVTLNTTGTITGNIEYGSDGTDDGKADVAEKARLSIKRGTIKGNIITGGLDTDGEADIAISGGTFSTSVAQYVVSSLKYELNNSGAYTYYPTLSDALANAESGAVITGLAEGSQGATTYYTVIFDTNGGSYVSPQTVESGSTATEPAAPSREGYRFTGWYLNGYAYNFSTPVAGSITLTAGWEKISSGGTAPVRDITVDSGSHGDVEIWPEEAKQGTTVTITTDPDKGYEVAEVVVTDENGTELTVTDKGNGKYTFTMPNSDVTIEVTFQAVSGGSTSGGDLTITAPAGWVNPYTDVAASAWYYNAVGYASANGLMGGVGNNAFAPSGTMNRAMVWTVIARLAGQTISGESWAADAQAWAVAQGVSDGTNPDGAVSREELVTMLYRYAGSPAMNVPELGLIGNYPDSAAVSAWAQNAFAWAISQGIIEGRDGKLAAGDSITRAEAATILARFHLLTK